MIQQNTHPFDPPPESADGPSKRAEQPAEPEEERAEEITTPPDAPTQPSVGAEKQRARPSALDMLFREAEVIAQNLKESGTRR